VRSIIAAVVAVVLALAALTGFVLFAVERRKRLRMEGETEVKSESSHSSGQEVLEAGDDASERDEWSELESHAPRHELSTQKITPGAELPAGHYGR
jgi:hypothetical protein